MTEAVGEPNPTPTPHAFETFYSAELDRQVRRAYLMVGSNDLANDIVHDAMIGLYRKWSEVDNPEAYLNRSVLNGCRDSGRRASKQRQLVSRIGSQHSSSSSAPHDVLDDVLASLPFQQRAAVVLRYFEQRSTADIAAALGCPPGSVGPWIDRALSKMRKALS